MFTLISMNHKPELINLYFDYKLNINVYQHSSNPKVNPLRIKLPNSPKRPSTSVWYVPKELMTPDNMTVGAYGDHLIYTFYNFEGIFNIQVPEINQMTTYNYLNPNQEIQVVQPLERGHTFKKCTLGEVSNGDMSNISIEYIQLDANPPKSFYQFNLSQLMDKLKEIEFFHTLYSDPLHTFQLQQWLKFVKQQSFATSIHVIDEARKGVSFSNTSLITYETLDGNCQTAPYTALKSDSSLFPDDGPEYPEYSFFGYREINFDGFKDKIKWLAITDSSESNIVINLYVSQSFFNQGNLIPFLGFKDLTKVELDVAAKVLEKFDGTQVNINTVCNWVCEIITPYNGGNTWVKTPNLDFLILGGDVTYFDLYKLPRLFSKDDLIQLIGEKSFEELIEYGGCPY